MFIKNREQNTELDLKLCSISYSADPEMVDGFYFFDIACEQYRQTLTDLLEVLL